MSLWYEVDDRDAVELSSDGKSVEVLFSTDRAGNNYVEIPIEFIRQLLDESTQPAIEAGRALVCNCKPAGWFDFKNICINCGGTKPSVQVKKCTCGVGQADKYCGACGGLLSDA